MADETEKKAAKVDIGQAHPELRERHDRINAVFVEARDAKRTGKPLPESVRVECEALLRWADGVVTEALGSPATFGDRVARDRSAFALALRLSGDELVARQLLMACDDLRSVL